MIVDVNKLMTAPDSPTPGPVVPPDYNAGPIDSPDRSWQRPDTPMPWSGIKTSNGECIKIRNAMLYDNILNWDAMTVANADEDLSIGDDTEVWLTITVASDLTVESAQIGTGAPTEIIKWTAATDTTPAIQTQAGVLIGETKDGRWYQYLTTNLLATLIVVDGKTALFPLAFAG